MHSGRAMVLLKIQVYIWHRSNTLMQESHTYQNEFEDPYYKPCFRYRATNNI